VGPEYSQGMDTLWLMHSSVIVSASRQVPAANKIYSRALYTRAAVTGKARSPMVDNHVRRTSIDGHQIKRGRRLRLDCDSFFTCYPIKSCHNRHKSGRMSTFTQIVLVMLLCVTQTPNAVVNTLCHITARLL